ncbi:MAG: dipeptide ABC transporter ATP-binding protein [Steroidobacteraceae bacterium]
MSSIPTSAERMCAAGEAPVLLTLQSLSVRFAGVPVVDQVSLTVRAGECLGVVGESGAGKSLTFLAALGLAPASAVLSGRAQFGASELIGLTERALDALRGRHIGLVSQDPMGALTPHLRIGQQLTEPMLRHTGCSLRAARARALELLEQVRLAAPARCLQQYPHELSGGMRQRVLLAIALSCEPQLLILDEPTTALDVTIQAQILALLAHIKRERQLGLVLVTHDFAALAGLADRVAVMRGGRVIETGSAAQVFHAPREPYTVELLQAAREPAVPGGAPGARGGGVPVLAVEDLTVCYRQRGARLRRRQIVALQGVTVAIAPGESLAVVGESGCGKSTLTRAALRLIGAAHGRIAWLGRDVGSWPERRLRALRRALQLIFQDPLASLDPHLTVERLVGEPLEVHHRELDAAARAARVAAMLERVGLDPALTARRPHELSGGQGQRVGIARAMILAPRLLICDEPLSALDVRAQRQIGALLDALRREQGMSVLLVSHDLGAVRRGCERVLVLYQGAMAELAPSEALFARPLHPYTRALLQAIPVADPDVQPGRLAQVRLTDLQAPPAGGCAFRARCPQATTRCAEQRPPWVEASAGRWVACHHFERGADGML